jgi:hypothetical protein
MADLVATDRPLTQQPSFSGDVSMSDLHSIPAATSGKPAELSPNFPLFAHTPRRWAKKNKGKMYYFGSWDDPDAALREYRWKRTGVL